MIRAAGLAILFLAVWTETTRADFSENIRRCDSDDTHPDIQIAACTRNIQSGRFTGRNLAVAFTNRGLAYKRKGQWDRAIADHSEAIRLMPDDAQIFADRGLAYEKKGDRSQAMRDFEKAYALGFRHPLLLKKLRDSGARL